MSITAILNVWRRPHTLVEQLQAVQQQSIAPEAVFIWQNAADGIELSQIPPELMQNVTIFRCSQNLGVWARFTVGLLSNSKYICVFDDDTIPQKDWFKNCVDTMQIKRGLLGTIGVRFNEGVGYHGPRFGWDGGTDVIEQVDIVGHAWFFERDWLSLLWEFRPDYSWMLKGGEDIAFSYCLQRAGINTYVPPHPKDQMNLWGSHPETAMKYGCDGAAISCTPEGFPRFHRLLDYFVKQMGFKTMSNRRCEEAGGKPW